MSLKLSEPMSQPWHSSAPARVDGAAAANTELSGRTIDSEDNLDKALVHAKDDVQIGYALNAVQHQHSAPTDLFGTAHVGGRETVEMLSRMKCSEVFRLSHEVSGGGLPSHTGTTVIDTPGSQIDLDHAQNATSNLVWRCHWHRVTPLCLLRQQFRGPHSKMVGIRSETSSRKVTMQEASFHQRGHGRNCQLKKPLAPLD